MKTILQILEEAKELIKNPEHWCQGDYTIDKNGLNLYDKGFEGSCKYCAIGSLMKASEHGTLYNNIGALDKAAQKLYGLDAVDVNDKLGHEAVMKVFDVAIEKEKNK